MVMNIDKMISDLDSFFENTPREHFEEIWNDVKKYEVYGPDVEEFLCERKRNKPLSVKSTEVPASYVPLSETLMKSIPLLK